MISSDLSVLAKPRDLISENRPLLSDYSKRRERPTASLPPRHFRAKAKAIAFPRRRNGSTPAVPAPPRCSGAATTRRHSPEPPGTAATTPALRRKPSALGRRTRSDSTTSTAMPGNGFTMAGILFSTSGSSGQPPGIPARRRPRWSARDPGRLLLHERVRVPLGLSRRDSRQRALQRSGPPPCSFSEGRPKEERVGTIESGWTMMHYLYAYM
jgi:hypothetical protein